MELRYMGFDQTHNTRAYQFDRVATGEATIRLVVTADLALFLRHRIGIQEGPTLSAHKLAADLDKLREGEHELTNEDLLGYVAARAATEARKTEARKAGARRRNQSSPTHEIPS